MRSSQVCALITSGKLARKRVPEGAFCVSLSEAGTLETTFSGGGKLPPGRYLALSEDPCEVELRFEQLSCRSGLSCDLMVRCRARFGRTAIDARLLQEGLLRDEQALDLPAFSRRLSQALRPEVASFAGCLEPSDIVNPRPELTKELELLLGEAAGRLGIEAIELSEHAFSGKELSELKAEAARSACAAEREAQRQRARLSLRRTIAQETAKIRAERLKAELASLKDIGAAFSETGLQAQVLALRDEKLKARLLELLLERELTPEQIRARRPGRTPAEVQAELAALRSSVRELLRLSGPACVVAAQEDSLRLWHVTPGLEPEEAGRCELGFGSVRSLGVFCSEGVSQVACGTTRGVLLFDPVKKEVLGTYQLPRQGTHGVNGVFLGADSVFATHWEEGLLSWPLQGGPVRRHVRRPCRGVAFHRDGRGACGTEDGIVLLKNGEEGDVRPLDGQATALCSWRDGFACGSERGTVFSVTGADLRILSRGPGPVTALVAVCWGSEGEEVLVVCRREQRLEVVGDSEGAVRYLVAPRPLRWAAASGPLIAASAKGGLMYLWWRHRVEEIAWELSLPGEVRALACLSLEGEPAEVGPPEAGSGP